MSTPLTQTIGDNKTFRIPCRWEGRSFSPGSEWNTIWTLFSDKDNPEGSILLQKETDLGIVHSGDDILVSLVPQDTQGDAEADPVIAPIPAGTYYWAALCVKIADGTRRHVADGSHVLKVASTLLSTPSVPIHTTTPPSPNSVLGAFSASSAIDPVVGTDEVIVRRSGGLLRASLTVISNFVRSFLGNSSTLDVGTTAGTVAAGDDERFGSESGEFVYFIEDQNDSVIAGYKKMDNPAQLEVEAFTTQSTIAEGQIVFTSITDLGLPGVTFIPAGPWQLHINAYKTGGSKSTHLYTEFYKRDLAGTETLLATTALSIALTGVEVALPTFAAYVEALTILSTDRIVQKTRMSLVGGGSNPTSVTVGYSGSTAARLTLPAQAIDGTTLLRTTDKSTGGNGAADAGKVAAYGSGGGLKTTSGIEIVRSGFTSAISAAAQTANRGWSLPDKDGTFAMTSDITAQASVTETLSNKTLTNPTVNNYTEGVVAIGNSGTSQTIALTSGTFQTVTLTGNCTFTMPTATAGKSFILKVLTGAGGFTGTFTSVKWAGGTAPTITAAASKYDLISFVADGSAWSGSAIQNFTA